MRSGLFSVSYAGLWGQTALSMEAFIEKAAELGFDGVLLMAKRPHLSSLDATEKRLEKVRKLLESKGLSLIGVGAYNDFLLEAPSEVPSDELQLLYIDACCRMASRLGGTLVRVFTGYERSTEPVIRQWNRLVELLQEAGERASEHGISLAVQNHHDLAVDSSAMAALLDDVGHPAVKAGFDAWSPFLRGEDLYESAKLMAPYTILSIAANYRRYPRYRYLPELVNYETVEPAMVRASAMTQGEIDYDAFLRGLTDGGYGGPLVYEMCSPLEGGGGESNLDAKAADFINYFRNKN